MLNYKQGESFKKDLKYIHSYFEDAGLKYCQADILATVKWIYTRLQN